MELIISEKEYGRRIEAVKKVLGRRRLDALYLTNATSIFYLTGYSFISTERPAALVIPLDGKTTFMGPLLEKDHVPLKTRLIEEVKTYLDYPGEKHPIEHFAEFLKEMGLTKKRIGIDNKAGAAGMWGYQGPPITRKLPEAKFVDMADLVPKMRLVKSPAEVALIRESAKWANLAVALLQEYTTEGAWDVEVALAASLDASSIMKKTLGVDFEPLRNIFPVSAGFRGQIGEISAIPHAIGTKRKIKSGDVVIAEAGVEIGGYSCELERTMIVGKPSAKQKRYFETMTKAQEAAIQKIKEGVECSEVDKASSAVFKKAGLSHLVKHHTGHGLGLEGHEPPWLDMGNKEKLKAGMVVSCEPGIYEVGFAGFRHSDTVLVTKEGCELITYYPREIEQLTIT
ncbi:MAG: Xaa-Pro peptidase family protein [Candidatus Bathyarchaeota archaeon]|jgi:Xaa-Pro aminopeptidase|nr:aminopeptidase P family protein [Candidatus Bathyarchaeota archaeon A05DMB-3]MDH7607034.1 Xaa-Pro peptidase family protein [Candidatus Bathyarchaeota archaeon]